MCTKKEEKNNKEYKICFSRTSENQETQILLLLCAPAPPFRDELNGDCLDVVGYLFGNNDHVDRGARPERLRGSTCGTVHYCNTVVLNVLDKKTNQAKDL